MIAVIIHQVNVDIGSFRKTGRLSAIIESNYELGASFHCEKDNVEDNHYESPFEFSNQSAHHSELEENGVPKHYGEPNHSQKH